MIKRLYNCNAHIELYENNSGYNYNLISYNTKICEVIIDIDCDGQENIRVKLWRYSSVTSQQHIRKFVKWLRQHISKSKAGVIVSILQEHLVKKGYNYGTYNGLFNFFNLNSEQLEFRGFKYGYSNL